MSQINQLRWLKAKLRRVTEERDILKKAAACNPGDRHTYIRTHEGWM